MRKIFFILFLIASTHPLFAQEPADALRYSWFSSGGTARQQSIGGAMGSLGGEISATFVNPAGIGFYKTGDFVITPEFHFLTTKATYFGRNETNDRNGFSFGTTGAVLGFGENNPKRNMRGSAVCIAINQTANFGSNILYRGQNNQSSYSQKFLEEIRNDKDANSVASAYPYGSSLAFNTYWIDTIAGGTPGNFSFKTRAPIGAGLLQENVISNKGGITELGIAGAANINDKFYFGGTLGIPFLYYKKHSVYTEADATSDGGNNFDFASITEDLTTQGVGINIRAGIIYKPVEYFRLGFAIHSPTYFFLTDKYHASVTTNTETYQGLLTQTSADVSGDENAEFKYDLLNPYRLIASAAYVFREIENVKKQRGFVTADIEFVNYKASSFHADSKGDNSESTKDYLKSLNRAIDNAYKAALNFRLGGEIKFTTFMLRLGGAYYGNPYKDLAGEKGQRFQLTGGLGYRNKGIFIDLAYVRVMGKDVHFPYRLDSNNFSGASIKNTGGSAVISVGFKI
jgi:hypothetical protein